MICKIFFSIRSQFLKSMNDELNRIAKKSTFDYGYDFFL